MTCELPGNPECPIAMMKQEIEDWILELSFIGAIADRANSLEAQAQAKELQDQIEKRQQEKNWINPCNSCPYAK